MPFDFLKRRRRQETDRFDSVSPDHEMLMPQQVQSLPQMVQRVNTEILYIHDTSDEMFPEYALFVPNLLAEFRENPDLAMIHGQGTRHAWIRVSMLREALSNSPTELRNYRDLFIALTNLGYDVRKIRYIYFRSSLK